MGTFRARRRLKVCDWSLERSLYHFLCSMEGWVGARLMHLCYKIKIYIIIQIKMFVNLVIFLLAAYSVNNNEVFWIRKVSLTLKGFTGTFFF